MKLINKNQVTSVTIHNENLSGVPLVVVNE